MGLYLPLLRTTGAYRGQKEAAQGGVAVEQHAALLGVPLRQGRQCAVLWWEEFCELPEPVEPSAW